MEWIYVKDELPPLGISHANPEFGRYKRSSKVLVGTQNGGIYIGYYEIDKPFDQECDEWNSIWYTSSVQDEDVDTDGVEIKNVIAWCKLPSPPIEK